MGRQVRLRGFIALGLGAAFMGAFLPFALATSDTWDGSDSGFWSASNNWLTNPAAVPGTGDTATFSQSSVTVNGRTTIDLGAGVTVAGIVFDAANAAAYTIGSGIVGSQTLTLDTTGLVTMNAAVVNNQLFNANVILGTATVGTTTITNSSTTNSLTFAGTLQGGTGGTAGVKTVNTTGAGTINFTNTVSAGGASVLNLANTGTGTVNLTGAVSSTLGTLRATGGGTVNIDGQTVAVANGSQYGSSTGNGKFELKSGSVAFNGGMSMNSSVGDGSLFKVSGGTFSATSVSLLRTWGNSSATATTAASATTGFVVTGGTASVTGVLDLAGSNSNTSALVSGGSLTVGGEVRIGNSTSGTGRFFVFQVSGGTFTSTDATGGIILARSSANANNTSLLLTGGTTTVERIAFGQSATATGSTGTLTLNGATASLYVGSGGIVKPALNTYTSTITLAAGTLGAKANWSSSLAMTLSGTADALTIKAADASNVARNITLDGALTGTGGYTKTGDGILSLGGTNAYQGETKVNAGTVLVNGAHTDAGSYTVAAGAKLGGAGSITGASASTITLGSSSFLMVGKTHGAGAGNDLTKQTLTLTTGVGDINLNGTLQFDLFSTDGDVLDLNSGSGFLDLSNAKVELALGEGANTSAWGTSFTTWRLIDWTNLPPTSTNLALSASTISTFQSLGYTLTQSIVDDGTANAGFYVNIALVPEPTRAVLLCLGLGTLLFTRRRSSRAANPCDAFVLQ